MAKRQLHDGSCIEFDPLRRRCIKLAKTGQYRKAAIALAELAHREQDAPTWVRLGAMLLRAGRGDAGIDALKQGLWLYRMDKNNKRAQVVSRLIERASHHRAA
ncbi:MAG: hypothetical protein K1X88_34990 [Nannocystaceae bacterium]|nr:hypothetical protein [Nannocystaceae bacterium]